MFEYKNRSCFIAGLLCAALVFTTVFQPIRSKALVPALPAIPVIAMKAYEAIKLPAAIYGALKGLEQAGNAFESIFGSTPYEFWKEHFTNKDDYNDYVNSFPYGLTASSSGVLAAGDGYEMLSTCDTDFWRTINIYAAAHSASVGQFMLLGAHGSATALWGVVLCQSTTGARYLRVATIDNVLPYTAANLPLGKFLTLNSKPNILADATYSTQYSYRWNTYLSAADAMLDANAGILPLICTYLTPASVITSVSAGRSSPGWGYSYAMASDQYELKDYGVTVSGPRDYQLAGYRSYSSGYNYYAANPRDHDVSEDYPDYTRLSSLMSILNEYNLKHTIAEGSDTINYYLVPVGMDVTPESIAQPGLYDEETLVYTDPVTGMEYLTTGWTYDYNTRCYSLTMGDTFLIGDTVITRIDLTYGDDVLTVEHYDADGTLVQKDTYNYVAVSGLPCALSGHSNTVEDIVPPTCTSGGQRKYTCSICGNEYIEDTPATEHPFTFSVITEATCTSPGLGVYTCATCGLQHTENIPALEHTPIVLEVVPSEYGEDGSLISVGYTKYECTECGAQYTVTDTVDIEEEGWFSWLGSLFKTLLSSIVNGLASGLEWLINKVIVTVTSWIIKAVEWVFGLFSGDHLTTLFGWFNDNNAFWNSEFAGETMFSTEEVAA